MATYYNTSTVTYDSATTPYDGQATVYTYAGSITLTIIISHVYFDTAWTYFYSGRMAIELDIQSPYIRGFLRKPTVSGLPLRIVPNSSMIIRQYRKMKDPVRTGGCPQCGTYVYNQ